MSLARPSRVVLRLTGFLAAASILAGCAALDPPGPRELSGPTDGYTPTSTFLKLHVLREDGTTAFLDFDRKDWYTAEIARRVDLKKLEHVTAQAQPRGILNEYLAQVVHAPEDLDALRYEAMGASHEQRSLMDTEYEELLRGLAPAEDGGATSPASGVLPGHALP